MSELNVKQETLAASLAVSNQTLKSVIDARKIIIRKIFDEIESSAPSWLIPTLNLMHDEFIHGNFHNSEENFIVKNLIDKVSLFRDKESKRVNLGELSNTLVGQVFEYKKNYWPTATKDKVQGIINQIFNHYKISIKILPLDEGYLFLKLSKIN
jgi:hypothetical protein